MLSEEMDIRAQIYALRHLVTGLYASILRSQPDALATVRRVAQEDIAGFEAIYEMGPTTDDGHELIQRSLHHLDAMWRSIEQNLE